MADADHKTLTKLEEYAFHIGLAFQIRDDILDIEGSEEMIGKNIGRDVEKQKSTYPKLLTMKGAKEKLKDHLLKAEQILSTLPIEKQYLSIYNRINRQKKQITISHAEIRKKNAENIDIML